jgi:hypothetical protein
VIVLCFWFFAALAKAMESGMSAVDAFKTYGMM